MPMGLQWLFPRHFPRSRGGRRCFSRSGRRRREDRRPKKKRRAVRRVANPPAAIVLCFVLGAAACSGGTSSTSGPSRTVQVDAKTTGFVAVVNDFFPLNLEARP